MRSVDLSTGRPAQFAFALTFALTFALCLLRGHEAGANMAKWWRDGEGYGALVPQQATDVRVDSEDLSFTVAPSLDHAEVTATYRMTNGSAVASSAEVAFVVVAAELAGTDSTATAPRASITIDGTPVAFRVVTDADVLGPALDAWLVAHPEIGPELARLSGSTMPSRDADYDKLRRLVPGCLGECRELLRWYEQRRSTGTEDAGVSREASILPAAEVAIPEEVAKLQNGWSTLAHRRRLSWLAFPLDLGPGATRTVSVRYTHRAGTDARVAVNTVFTYEYLLSPAKRWARFGDLHLTIQMPPGAQLRASLPLTQEGTTYRATLPGLPGGELALYVMSQSGLVFGMTQPTGYWLLLVAAMTLVTVPIGALLGRRWSRVGSRPRKALRCVFGTGPLALAANGVVVWWVSLAFPARAFGYGYGAGLGLMAVVFLFAAGGMVISLVTAFRQRA